MNFGYSDTCLDHDTGPRHPETPDRLRAIREGLKRKHGVAYVEPDPASVASIERVHDAAYVQELKEFCADGGGDWDPDTTAVAESWDAILQSAGISQWVADAALDGEQGRDTPFSLGRPPGHHAVEDDAMGFCFVNNVSMAADRALDAHDVDKVAVVDWDVHHGNGTQDIWYDSDRVFFASIQESGLYPGTGGMDETGEGDGDGATLNLPMPAGAGDAEYAAAIADVVAPAIERYDPELVLVSAGFDAHRHDPISRMRVSTEGYAIMTDQLRELADSVGAPIGFVLEGGYGLDVLAEGVAMVHETFDGRDPIPVDEDVDDDVRDLLEESREIHGLDD